MQRDAPIIHPSVEEQGNPEFDWGDLFYKNTPVEIIRIIVEMEEDLI